MLTMPSRTTVAATRCFTRRPGGSPPAGRSRNVTYIPPAPSPTACPHWRTMTRSVGGGVRRRKGSAVGSFAGRELCEGRSGTRVRIGVEVEADDAAAVSDRDTRSSRQIRVWRRPHDPRSEVCELRTVPRVPGRDCSLAATLGHHLVLLRQLGPSAPRPKPMATVTASHRPTSFRVGSSGEQCLTHVLALAHAGRHGPQARAGVL